MSAESSQAPAVVHRPLPHDSAKRHVSGTAEFIDDIFEPQGTLHAYFGLSERARAKVLSLNLDAVRGAPGVVGVLTASDVPEGLDISAAGAGDEPLFASGEVMFWGQPLFAVIAGTRDEARRAARMAGVSYKDLPPVISIDEARGGDGDLVTEPLTLARGDIAAAMAAARHRISGQMEIGGQDHLYLEGQIALAIPGEGGDITVISSSQHPGEVQHVVAHVLGVPAAAVTVMVRRMGGAFGGKETQGSFFAAVAALAAKRFGRAVKFRAGRDDDMIATGKRHDFLVDYDIGFDDNGSIVGVEAKFFARCGYSADLSGPVTDRALFHADNAYFYPAVHVRSVPLRTNTVSNTAFRGFGGPQGMLVAERMIEEIAYKLGKDPLEVRRTNFYGAAPRNLTPYHQTVEDNIIGRIVDELEVSSNYQDRRGAVLAFNARSGVIKRGIALTPVKFGISFTATWFNQAGALVHIYKDGSIHLNHGGTEMGQGLNTKVAQVLADEFGVPLERIAVTATTTGKVPNASATAASSGSDLNGMAAKDAAEQIKAHLIAHAADTYGVAPDSVGFGGDCVFAGEQRIGWAEFINGAYMARVHLSAAGFYKTPKIHWDRARGEGRPFLYYAYGAAVSEVSVDTLSGEYHVDRADILHDCGKSLNPAIDIGQIEGGFVQGMGWLTSEELVWDEEGVLWTHAPATYKIPLASDRPPIFNVALCDSSENREATIRRSKAVGEPPLMLAISVLEAMNMAVASLADYRVFPRLDAPATPERVLMAAERLRRRPVSR